MSNGFARLLDGARTGLVALFVLSLVLSIGDVSGTTDVTLVGLLGFPGLADPVFYVMLGSLAAFFAVTAARSRVTDSDPDE